MFEGLILHLLTLKTNTMITQKSSVITTCMAFYLMLLSRSLADVSCILM